MVSINSMFPSKYVSAPDLRGQAIDVVMGNVTMEDVDGRGEMKPLLQFQGKEKGLVLNKTNANRIVDLYGDDTAAWFGKTICLYPSETEFQGKTVPCVRVNAPGNVLISAWKQQQANQVQQPTNGGQPPVDAMSHTDSGVGVTLDDDIPF